MAMADVIKEEDQEHGHDGPEARKFNTQSTYADSRRSSKMSDLMDYDLGAPSRPPTSRKTGLDRSGFQMAAGRILDDVAKFAVMSVPLLAYTRPSGLKEPLSPVSTPPVHRIIQSMPLTEFFGTLQKAPVVLQEPPARCVSMPEEPIKRMIESDELEEDGLLFLEGAEQLVTKTRSNRSVRSLGEVSQQTSSAQWQEPEQGVIIVDWDDTLFPTSWLSEKQEFKSWQKRWSSSEKKMPEFSHEDLQQLAELDQAARSFVTAASALGQVCCVTLSRRPWQQNTMSAFMPKLASAWEEEGIQVVYASETFVISQGVMATECRHSSEMAAEEQETIIMNRAMKKKETAMKRVIKHAYEGKSWKNVISFKHVNPKGHKGDQKSFRMKAVQMLDSPSCSELITQLQILQAWLPALMHLDDDFFVTLGDSEEDIMAMHQKLLDRLEGGN
eukprot:s1822_g11.t1